MNRKEYVILLKDGTEARCFADGKIVVETQWVFYTSAGGVASMFPMDQVIEIREAAPTTEKAR